LLLAPTEHFENFSEAIRSHESEFAAAFALVKDKVSAFGHVLAFEHGATKSSGGACGIYHAHMHFVPLPYRTTAGNLGFEIERAHSNLESALMSVRGRSEYILLQDTQGDISTLSGAPFGSQFMRKRIVEAFGLGAPTDWRSADKMEPTMRQALSEMQPHFALTQGTGRTNVRTFR
jgi:diadenosine tetraphosphate (Ap4A) HIT family hydrolase